MSVAHERLQEVVAGIGATLQREHAAFLRVRSSRSFLQICRLGCCHTRTCQVCELAAQLRAVT